MFRVILIEWSITENESIPMAREITSIAWRDSGDIWNVGLPQAEVFDGKNFSVQLSRFGCIITERIAIRNIVHPRGIGEGSWRRVFHHTREIIQLCMEMLTHNKKYLDSSTVLMMWTE